MLEGPGVSAIPSQSNLSRPTVPAAWEPVVQKLAAFIEVEETLRRTSPETARRRLLVQLHALHSQLIDLAECLIDPSSVQLITPAHDLRLLARAGLVLANLSDAVGVDRPLIDTAGCPSLTRYRPDFLAVPEHLQQLRLALKHLPGMTDSLFDQVQQMVLNDLQDACRKHAVVDSLCEEFGLATGATDLNERIMAFFEACFPETGLVTGEVRIIVTGCLIFFCIPFEGTELQTERYRGASPDQQEATRRFLERLKQFAQWQFAHFPAFGFLRGESLAPQLQQRLAKRSGLSVKQVCHELSRLMTIVPLGELEKYVVHDVWGHGWQASLLHYDRLYEKLATFADPIPWEREIRDGAGNRITWSDCFEIRAGTAKLVRPRFETFVQRLAIQRLPIALTPLIAELLADIAEHKLMDATTDADQKLPNSSFLAEYPSKLDLLLQDLGFYFPQATKVWRRLATSPRQQKALTAALVARGATESSATAAISELQARWQILSSSTFAPRLAWQRQGDQLQINLFTQLALNLLGVHRASLIAYEQAARQPVGALPMASFRDLLLIAAAIFFEEDPQQNLWRLDEYLALRIAPLCRLLAESSQQQRESPEG
jgi:hypothetical protein